ncbi:MAG TPA: helical backbone metal receptor [Actinomycetota bacterium]|nr:helical backbone metal receptor [Actinomycetota bacterium]
MRARTQLAVVTLVVANLLGLAAFLWPFLLPGVIGGEDAHRVDAPWIVVGLLICLGTLLFVELGRGGMGPKTVALVGVLGAAMVALRLPGFVAGFSAMFIIVLLAGNAFGPSFGFILGATGMFASGLFVGGIGPWLPFQMVAVAWVGMGAGVMPRGPQWGIRIAALAAYGVFSGFAFGAIMNLWSWPYLAGSAGIGWHPELGMAANLRSYATFYLVTSLTWDVFRAAGNAILVLVLGRPLLRVLDRAALRMRLQVRPVVLVVLTVALALPLVACRSGNEPGAAPSPAASDGFPVTVAAANGEVVVPRRPQRIVSLSPTATEMLFAIGAGDQVIAADESSNYPPEAPDTDLSGSAPDVDAVVAYEPDLVVASEDPEDLERSLAERDVPFLWQPAARTFDDTYGQLKTLGAATGYADGALQVIDSMLKDIDEIRSSVPTFDEPPTYFHEIDDSYRTATSMTFIGMVYGSLGLRNIADAADAATPYPQLSADYIIEADPDLIFLADTKCCGQSAASVARRPGWGQITAVRTGGIIELDYEITSRWGPRLVDFLRAVATALQDVKA